METLKSKGISLLRWSEKYTKTDMVYMFKNSFWVFVGQAATSITALVVMVLLANILSKETLGEYRFIVSAITILSVFTLQGMNPAVVQSVARGNVLDITNIVATKIRWGLVGLVVTLGISGYYFLQSNELLSWAFLIIAAALPLYGAYFLYFFYLQGQQRFAQASITQALGRIFFMCVMIGTALVAPTLLPLTVAFLFSTIVAQWVGYLWFKKHTSEDTTEDPELNSYAFQITWLGAISLIAANVDKILVWNFLGAEALAIYAIALMLPQESSRIARIISQVILPKLSERAGRINIMSFVKKLILFEGIMVLGWFVYALIAPLIFALFFPLYTESVSISIFAMLILLSMPIYMIRQFFIANKNKKELNRVLVITPIIQMVVLYAGLSLYGLNGAVFAFLFGGFLELVIGMVYLLLLRKPIQSA